MASSTLTAMQRSRSRRALFLLLYKSPSRRGEIDHLTSHAYKFARLDRARPDLGRPCTLATPTDQIGGSWSLGACLLASERALLQGNYVGAFARGL